MVVTIFYYIIHVFVFMDVLAADVEYVNTNSMAVSGIHQVTPSLSCIDRGSCENAEESVYRNCHCDDMCVLYGDCCVDYSHMNRTNQTPQDTLSCIPIATLNVSFSGILGKDGILIVNRCPVNFSDDNIRGLCEMESNDEFLTVPVSDIQTKILYKNYFCAACHDLDMDEVKFWKIQNKCYNNMTINNEMNETFVHDVLQSHNHDCKREMVTPLDTIGVRRCRKAIMNCPENMENQGIKSPCSNHTNYVYDGPHLYKNKYCAMCNGVSEFHLRCNLEHYLKEPISGLDDPVMPPSFRVMLDLNSGVVGVESIYTNNTQVNTFRQCVTGHVYDPYKQKCRPYICPPGQRLIADGNTCVFRNESHCRRMAYNLTDVVIDLNGNLTVDDQMYTPDEYILDENVVYICVPDSMSNNYTTSENITTEYFVLNYSRVESVVTVIGLSISLVCLVICIVIHSIFPALRNLAGKCVLGLACSLFVGQLLFLTATRIPQPSVCYVIAVILHYAFLASFCWTNCLSIDVCLAFSTKYNVPDQSMKRFIKYSVYAWSLPAVFVTLAIMLDFLPGIEDSYRPHYGDQYCLINRNGALLVTFATPVALILAINFILFIMTTRNIYKAKKVAQFAKKKRSGYLWDFFLYTKLYIIMGLTWLFGFLATTVGGNVLWYFFIILNTLQGALLCFAFLFTKKTKKVFRGGKTSLLSSSSQSRHKYNIYLNKKDNSSSNSSV